MKAKVTKITKMDKKDNYGNSSFIIELENGDKGFYNSKDENQKKFTVGQESEYNIEKKTGSTGTEYFKITTPQGEFQKQGFKPQDPRISMISFSMSYTKDLVVSGKVTMEQLEKTFERIYEAMKSKI